MPIATKPLAFVAIITAIAATPAVAQHSHSPAPGASPYAGQQARAIKALSEKEVSDLMSGAGMGFAKAAELNRYPGPMHALEHAAALQLTAQQEKTLKDLMHSHKAEARTLGARVVALEQELDSLFASGHATAEAVDGMLARLAEANARLRGEHLKTHLKTTALLTPVQVDKYVQVRGYAAGAAGGHRH